MDSPDRGFSPANFMLVPTMACQAACKYCFARKSGQVMSDATLSAAVDFMARIAPEKKKLHVTFHGGEPLLPGADFYRKALPMMRERFGRRIRFSVQSNLWAVTDELAELFRKYGVSVGTSLDGYREMCDEQRGEGYYDRTTRAEELLAAHGIESGRICTFSALHADKAGEVFARSARPYAVHGAVPSYGMPDSGLSVTCEQMARILLDSFEAYRNDPARSRISTIDSMARGCFEGKGCVCTHFDCLGVFAAISPEGDVYSCQRFCGNAEFCLGNVNDGLTEKEILASEGFRRLFACQSGMKSACGDCAHFKYCNGGCLYNTLTAGTDKDPYCEAYRKAFNAISLEMAKEMAAVMLGKAGETPVLAMAGDRPHPYDQRTDRLRMQKYIRLGKTPEPYAEKHLRDRYPENGLNKLYLHLTFDCPLRCPHCYAEGGERKIASLPAERFAEIIREAADNGFRSVVLTGGEPLVYKEFDKLCALLRESDLKGTQLVLRSSFGFEIPEERLRRICELFDEIVVSIDGGEEVHDARRGAGRYRLSVDNLKKAAALGFADRLGLAAALYEDGREENEAAVCALAEELGIGKVRIRPVLPLGRGAGAAETRYRVCSEETDFSAGFRPRFTCGLGQNLYVEPDGKAYPCYAWCEKDKLLGDLRDGSLTALLDRGELYAYCAHTVDTNEKCRGCEVRYLCGGICKAWVKDRTDIDSGNFDCAARKQYYLQIAEKTEGRE